MINKRKTGITMAGILILGAVLAGLTGCDSPVSEEAAPAEALESAAPPISAVGDVTLDAFFDNIQAGGPPMDGIPPIEEPAYIDMTDADSVLSDNDVVFVVESSEGIYVYPQSILVWHEVVNETFDGEKRSITYCPLTGSTIGYSGILSAGETTYGTSGKLLNSNLVMYDRATTSYIPQILGVAVSGQLKGERLEEFPVIWTRWHLVKDYYDEVNVLSRVTGFIRDYQRDPYGSYRSGDDYYNNDRLIFPVMHEDDRFSPKEVVLANHVNNTPFAVLKKTLEEKRLMEFDVADQPLVAVYEAALDTGRVFLRDYEDQVLTFEIKDSLIIDQQTESVWNERGLAVQGVLEGAQLELINVYDVMWFGWFAFHPQTEVYE